jgi:D-alanyl-D-alanine carboxypeptidase
MRNCRPIIMGIALAIVSECQATEISDKLDRLVNAYPEALTGHDDEFIFWRDGTKMPVGKLDTQKSFDDLLRHASILDQFKLSYPKGELVPPSINADPGRFRSEAFFKKMYGDCSRGEVDKNLVPIAWLPNAWGRTVLVTRVNGLADKLKAVSDEIETLDPAIKRAAYPIAGVFSCRPVADTGSMSMHGYAAAIDLNLNYSDYWLWNKNSQDIPYRNRMPQQIVNIFERHGFIWGGRWYHYDTMHFEYRPELLNH